MHFWKYLGPDDTLKGNHGKQFWPSGMATVSISDDCLESMHLKNPMLMSYLENILAPAIYPRGCSTVGSGYFSICTSSLSLV